MSPVDWVHWILALAFLAIWVLAGVIVARERC
jgi:hypothetical protein